MTQGSIAPHGALTEQIADLKEQRITAIQAQLPSEG
jgi:hypothetical protein